MHGRRRWALAKWSCLGVAVGSVLFAGWLMWSNSKAPLPEESIATDGAEPQAKVEKPFIVERKGERIIWRLQADLAEQQEQGMRLIEPRLELFTEAGEVIPIQGREAWFEPLKKNIRFKGAVQVNYREWTLNSETLHYDSGRDEAVIDGRFKAARPGTTLRGRGLRVERKTERLIVEHDVRMEDSTSRTLGVKP